MNYSNGGQVGMPGNPLMRGLGAGRPGGFPVAGDAPPNGLGLVSSNRLPGPNSYGNPSIGNGFPPNGSNVGGGRLAPNPGLPGGSGSAPLGLNANVGGFRAPPTSQSGPLNGQPLPQQYYSPQKPMGGYQAPYSPPLGPASEPGKPANTTHSWPSIPTQFGQGNSDFGNPNFNASMGANGRPSTNPLMMGFGGKPALNNNSGVMGGNNSGIAGTNRQFDNMMNGSAAGTGYNNMSGLHSNPAFGNGAQSTSAGTQFGGMSNYQFKPTPDPLANYNRHDQQNSRYLQNPALIDLENESRGKVGYSPKPRPESRGITAQNLVSSQLTWSETHSNGSKTAKKSILKPVGSSSKHKKNLVFNKDVMVHEVESWKIYNIDMGKEAKMNFRKERQDQCNLI